MIESMPDCWTRQSSLDYAFWLLKGQNFAKIITTKPLTSSDHTVALLHHMWASTGAQSIIMPQKFAAALMATDVSGVDNDQIKMPWMIFEIQIPPGLLRSSEGDVHSVFVAKKPSVIQLHNDPNNEHNHFYAYADRSGCAVMSIGSFAEPITTQWLTEEVTAVEPGHVPNIAEQLIATYDPNIETRLWNLIQRLAIGTILTIDNMKKDYVEGDKKGKNPFPDRPLKTKHDKLKANTYEIGYPMKLDCRPAIHEYLDGVRKSAPSVTTVVRGHWRNQAYGVKHSLRRQKWIQPFTRGQGPILVRATKIDAP